MNYRVSSLLDGKQHKYARIHATKEIAEGWIRMAMNYSGRPRTDFEIHPASEAEVEAWRKYNETDGGRMK